LEALKSNPEPDLIIASSWGGAIMSSLILEGEWQGNTLLLAPALYKINEVCGVLKTIECNDSQNKSKIHIVQAYEDEMIPYNDAFKLDMDLKFRNNEGSIVHMINDKYGHCLTEFIDNGQFDKHIKELIKINERVE
jgi:predicted esterase